MYETRQNKEKVSRVIQLLKNKEIRLVNYKTDYILQKINSNQINFNSVGNVAKAPTGIGNDRHADARSCIAKVNNNTNFSARGGEVSHKTRVDIQGSSYDNTCYNVQLQANHPYEDLEYPLGTSLQERGTSLAEVHIQKIIINSIQQDVKNRGLRLLRYCLNQSLDNRSSYKIEEIRKIVL